MGEDGGSQTYRGTFSYALLVTLVSLLLVGIMLLDPPAALAQQTQDLMEEGGRDIGVVDWLYRLPLALGAALLVIVVDAVVIVQILRGRWGRQ